MNQLTNEKGFTLIELLIAVVISLIVMAGTYLAFEFQHRAYITEEEVTEMQQNLRAAMLILERDIRRAGFDPTTIAKATIIDATAISITFTLDENVDQTLDANGDGMFDNGEAFTYTLYDSTIDADTELDDLGRDPDGITGISDTNGTSGGNATYQVVAENIEAVEFIYTLADGTRTTTPGNLNEIRAIQVWLLARTSREISDMPNFEDYNLLLASRTADPNGNPIPSAVFNTICGGGACNDNFRRRIATTSIKCRNMP